MEVSNNLKIKDLQAAFQQSFPFLKIEFYATPHEMGEGSLEQDVLDPELTIGEIRKAKNVGFITIDENSTTGDFEKMVQEQFGLNIQVFRKSYHRWLQTWVTDTWSLKEQNRRGGIMGEQGVPPKAANSKNQTSH